MPQLSLRHISKRFGPTVALNEVTMDLPFGSVVALLGENGAGKSTLMHILSGALAPDSGTMTLEGQPYHPRNPADALRAGVAMVHQELSLVPHLNGWANLALGREKNRLGWLRPAEERRRARTTAERVGLTDAPWDQPVGQWPLAARQLLEIARALLWRPRVLVLDEPTSALSSSQTQTLFSLMHELKSQGVCLVFITHHMEEVPQVADSWIVLRDGNVVDVGAVKNTRMEDLIQKMVGRPLTQIFPQIQPPGDEVVLRVDALAGRSGPAKVSFRLKRGEIFGLAGLMGAGRSETLRTLFGLNAMRHGQLSWLGKTFQRSSVAQAIENRWGFVSEDRKSEGLMLGRSLRENLTLSHLRPYHRSGFLSLKRERLETRHWLQRLGVRHRDVEQPIRQLSGGNQQKIAVGRLLHQGAELLLLDEPTQGIDVGSRHAIYQWIAQRAAEGASIILASSQLPELLGLCHTIGVMRAGQLLEVRPSHQWNEHELIKAALPEERL